MWTFRGNVLFRNNGILGRSVENGVTILIILLASTPSAIVCLVLDVMVIYFQTHQREPFKLWSLSLLSAVQVTSPALLCVLRLKHLSVQRIRPILCVTSSLLLCTSKAWHKRWLLKRMKWLVVKGISLPSTYKYNSPSSERFGEGFTLGTSVLCQIYIINSVDNVVR